MRFVGGALPPVPSGAPVEQQIAAINRIVDRLNQMLTQQTFSDGVNRRMLIGYQKDGWGDGLDFGIKISIPGVDVMEAADDELLFKMDISTWYWYDASTNTNPIQLGLLPDGTYNLVVAKTGRNVADQF
jgi:hypothetical protein